MKGRAPAGGRRASGDRSAAPSDASTHAHALTLADVYRLHADFVWRVLRRQGVEEHALEDLMHDVFLIVHRRLHEFDGRAAMTTWLYNITRGVASNHKRGRAREQRRLRSVRPVPSSATDPEVAAGRGQAAQLVREFLDTLDPDKRRIFELVDLDGLAVPEAAEICRVNVNTAYSRLRAARRAFQDAVDRFRRTGSAKREVG